MVAGYSGGLRAFQRVTIDIVAVEIQSHDIGIEQS